MKEISRARNIRVSARAPDMRTFRRLQFDDSYDESDDGDLQEEGKRQIRNRAEDAEQFAADMLKKKRRSGRYYKDESHTSRFYSYSKSDAPNERYVTPEKSTTRFTAKSNPFSTGSEYRMGNTEEGDTQLWKRQQSILQSKRKKSMQVGRRKAIAGGSGADSTSSIGAETAEQAGESAGAKIAATSGETAATGGIAGIVIMILVLIILGLVLVTGIVMSMTNMLGGAEETLDSTSYITDDTTILTNENAYKKLEKRMKNTIRDSESIKSGYDEYRYSLNGAESDKASLMAALTHDPYVLTSYLTAKFQDYKDKDLGSELQSIFAEQYGIGYSERTETRYRDVKDKDGNTVLDEYGHAVQESYQWRIMTVSLRKKDMDEICSSRVAGDAQQSQLYGTYKVTKGNRANLFGGSSLASDDYYHFSYNNDDETADHTVEYAEAASAVSGTGAERMYEAGKTLLGKPYVMGAAHGNGVYSSNPSAVDCSSFVSWVINHSIGDVGDNVTDGLLAKCDAIPSSEATAGDIIFFSGTYNTTYKTSHVGIYLGNGQMMHAGSPVKISSINTGYWQQHFYTFARLKSQYRNS